MKQAHQPMSVSLAKDVLNHVVGNIYKINIFHFNREIVFNCIYLKGKMLLTDVLWSIIKPARPSPVGRGVLTVHLTACWHQTLLEELLRQGTGCSPGAT